jgi:hypothetical protein
VLKLSLALPMCEPCSLRFGYAEAKQVADSSGVRFPNRLRGRVCVWSFLQESACSWACSRLRNRCRFKHSWRTFLLSTG